MKGLVLVTGCASLLIYGYQPAGMLPDGQFCGEIRFSTRGRE
jgi:hypothetical protein